MSEVETWESCYNSSWVGEIVPEAMSHPAKVARGLAHRIYEHALANGWLHPGNVVVDPFAGIGGFALDAMWNGLHWVGVELESRFVTLGEQSLALWRRRYGEKAGFGSARLLQGDSRNLASAIRSAEMVIASPPYSGSEVASACKSQHPDGRQATYKRKDKLSGYGDDPANLGAMKEGSPPQVDCVVGSPPYASSDQNYADGLKYIDREKSVGGRQRDGNYAEANYGTSPGQLASMPEGRFDAVVSSPPYEGQELDYGDRPNRAEKLVNYPNFKGRKHWANNDKTCTHYGNMGSGDTFWSAAREIVAQCHAVLRPGGHAIWVVKDFVRKGKRVPFSDQWQALCESQGFTLVCRHRAMLVTHHGEQETIFGETERMTTERKSFFRRLAEKKGSPAIDWEDVICLVRTP